MLQNDLHIHDGNMFNTIQNYAEKMTDRQAKLGPLTTTENGRAAICVFDLSA